MMPFHDAGFRAGKTWDVLETLGRAGDASLDFIVLLTPGGEVVYLNQATRELIEHPDAEPSGLPLEKLQPEWVCELMREEGIPAALRDGRWQGETVLLRADGTELPVYETLLSVGSEEEPMVAAVLRDLTPAKRRDLEQIELTNGYQAAIRASGEVLFQWDLATGGIEYHGNMEGLLGYSAAEMAGGLERLRGLLHPDDLEAFDREVQRAAQARTGFDVHFRVHRPDGSFVRLHGRGAFYLDRTGTPSKLAGLLLNGTELWHAQEQLALAREKLESRLQTRLQEARDEVDQSRRAKSELLSRMSHELRTPLNAILGFTQLLELETPTPRQAESIEHITRAGQHLLSLVNEVLDLARLESGRLPLHFQPVEIAPFLRSAMETMRPLAERSQVAMILEEAPAETPAHIQADGQRLLQVLLNLLSNAIKLNRPQGTVTLRFVASGPGRVRISVVDTGQGFAPARLRSLLAPMPWQENESANFGHSGLGLALSRGLVQALKGELGGESELGRGSTFWVDLPAGRGQPISAESPTPRRTIAPSSRPGTSKLLYVEDEELNLQLVERVLAGHPEYELITTMQGSQAYDLARQHRPDLILLDLNLPDLSGEVVLAQIKEDPELQDTPVIMVTADVMGDRVERLLTGGALTYLTKPFRISEFLAVIRETLHRPPST